MPRTVRYNDFEGCRAAVAPHAPRLDEVLAGVEWAIAVGEVEDFHTDPATGLSILLTDPFPGAPALAVYFEIEDDDYATIDVFELDPEATAELEDDDADDG